MTAVSRSDEIIQAGELLIRPAYFTASVRGRVLSLSRREFELLVYLSRHSGLIVPRDELYLRVWGEPLDPRDRSVDVYVHRLRVKLGAVTPEWQYIHTHFGLGYRFQPERSQLLHTGATA